jgi:hypothetical protein
MLIRPTLTRYLRVLDAGIAPASPFGLRSCLNRAAAEKRNSGRRSDLGDLGERVTSRL